MGSSSAGSSIAAVLEVGIVLATIYVTLSCVCSWVQEQLAAVLSLRGKTLYQGVLNLVIGHKALTDAIFASPFIVSSSNDKGGVPQARDYRPSYIDAHNFTLSFWQSVRSVVSAQPGATVANAVDTGTNILKDLESRASSLGPGPLQTAVLGLLNEAQGDYGKLLAVTDKWFNAQMDRVSGWYRRQSQWILVVIAVFVVTFSGIDSIEIAKRLYIDPTLRGQLVDSISKNISSTVNKENAETAKEAGKTASPQSTQTPSTPSGKEPSKTDRSATTGSTANEVAQDLLNKSDFMSVIVHPTLNPVDTWRFHTVGAFVTLVALSLGGPFWFDALCTLVNVRAVGKKPESK